MAKTDELPDEMSLEDYLTWYTAQNSRGRRPDPQIANNELSGSHIENTLALHIRTTTYLPEPEREYRFAAALVGSGKGLRKRLAAASLQDWRFDFAYPDRLIGIECEGGTWSGGRHNRAKGYEDDCRKYNAAQLLGWRVFRFTSDMVASGEAVRIIEKALA